MPEFPRDPGAFDIAVESAMDPARATELVRDRTDCIVRLQSALLDFRDMAALRTLLADISGVPGPLIDDHDAVVLASEELARGRLRVMRHEATFDLPAPTAGAGPPRRSKPPPPPQEKAAAPRRSRPAPRRPAPSGPDPIQFMDQQAQAATLVAAAESGVPFCEECARRAAERGAA